MSKSAVSTKLKVIARAPFQLYFDGEANYVSANNVEGQFDVLPGHADFFSVLSPGEVTIESDSDATSFQITNGILTVQNDEVMLFVNM